MENNLIDLSLLFTEGIQVVTKEPFEKPDVNFAHVLRTIRSKIPKSIFDCIDCIYIGKFNFNEECKYEDNAIYVSNSLENEKEIVEYIVHELGSVVEQQYSEYLYSDDKLIEEFRKKRNFLLEKIEKKKFDFLEKIDEEEFQNIEYSESFEKFLFDEIGYSNLKEISKEIFYSPKSALWIEEYFKSGFQAFILGDKKTLKALCPVLYNKIYNCFKKAIV